MRLRLQVIIDRVDRAVERDGLCDTDPPVYLREGADLGRLSVQVVGGGLEDPVCTLLVAQLEVGNLQAVFVSG